MSLRQMISWVFLSWKRMLRRPFFLMVLLLLPIGTMLLRQVERQDDGKIEIALFADGDAWNEKVIERLADSDGAFRFFICTTREELVNKVAAGEAECGYLFPAGLHERLDSHDYKRAIRVIVSPGTVTADLASESVFAGLFEVYGRELLEEYVTSGEVFDHAEDAWTAIAHLYDKHLENGSTFAFSYESVEGGKDESPQMQAVFPVRGIGAVLVFVMGLASAVMVAEDDMRGLYAAVSGGQKMLIQLLCIGAQVAICCLIFSLCLAAAGEWGSESAGGAVSELIRLSVYGFGVTILSGMLLRVLRKPVVLAGLIPIFVLGSLVVCPVFFDLSVYVPVLKSVRWLFLPWYFIRM